MKLANFEGWSYARTLLNYQIFPSQFHHELIAKSTHVLSEIGKNLLYFFISKNPMYYLNVAKTPHVFFLLAKISLQFFF